MKKTLIVAVALFMSAASFSYSDDAFRIAVLDFENQAGELPSYVPSAALSSQALAEKGAFLLNKKLSGEEGFNLIDRRDFFAQMDRVNAGTSDKVSFLRTAQNLNADVVLRGSLLTLSSSRSAVHQGGYKAFFDDISVRVGLEALDTRDGHVLAASDGLASRRFRQTDNQTTMLGEDDVLLLMEGAMTDAIPGIRKALEARRDEFKNKPTIKLSVTTSEDPALVEIDGLLIGSSPLSDFQIYAGDHVITVGKAGYRDITKRILLESDTRVEIPLLKTELSADEVKEVLEGARLNIYSGIEPEIIIHSETITEGE